MARTTAQARKARIATRKSTRKDPVARHIDDSPEWLKLQNKDDNLRYIAAYDGCQETGTQYYRDLGYHEVEAEKDGVRWGGTSAGGTGQLNSHGHTLMAISKEDYDEIVAYGEGGNTGQVRADEVDKKILEKGGTDSLRGEIGAMSGGHMDVRIAED